VQLQGCKQNVLFFPKNKCIWWKYKASDKIEYTPHILTNILVYLLKGQYSKIYPSFISIAVIVLLV